MQRLITLAALLQGADASKMTHKDTIKSKLHSKAGAATHTCGAIRARLRDQSGAFAQWNNAQTSFAAGVKSDSTARPLFTDQTFKGADAMYWEDAVVDPNDQMKDNYAKGQGKIDGWQRITKYDGKPSLWGSKGVKPDGSVQGNLGSCWFLAAASALAEYPDRIHKMFQNTAYPANGIFLNWFYQGGERLAIVVDDDLPYTHFMKDYTGEEYTPVNSRKSSNGAWWLPILEKSWCKMYGNCDNINGGQSYTALRDMSNMPVLQPKALDLGAAKTFAMAMEFDKKKYSMTTGCCKQKFGNLSGGHAYTMIGAVEIKNADGSTRAKLMKIRNPWGEETYNGPWSDNSSEWTDDFATQAGLVKNTKDGRFHIPVEDYIKTFGNWEVAMYDNWNISKVSKNTHSQSGQQQLNWKFTPEKDGELILTIDFLGQRTTTSRPECRYKNDFNWNLFIYNWQDAVNWKGALQQKGVNAWSGYNHLRQQVKAGQEYAIQVYDFNYKKTKADFVIQAYMMEGGSKLEEFGKNF